MLKFFTEDPTQKKNMLLAAVMVPSLSPALHLVQAVLRHSTRISQ